jgi:hypothetical protein
MERVSGGRDEWFDALGTDSRGLCARARDWRPLVQAEVVSE